MLTSANEATVSSMALNGTVLITSGVQVTGDYNGLYALTDVTITQIATKNCTKNMTGIAPIHSDFLVINQGGYLPVEFNSITITGTAILVK